jgi:hypothetical protein
MEMNVAVKGSFARACELHARRGWCSRGGKASDAPARDRRCMRIGAFARNHPHPDPMETPCVALLTMDSSVPMELVSTCSKYRSA